MVTVTVELAFRVFEQEPPEIEAPPETSITTFELLLAVTVSTSPATYVPPLAIEFPFDFVTVMLLLDELVAACPII